MRTDLAGDPSTLIIADELNIPIEHAIGLLHKFWCWADSQLTDGNAPTVTETRIDRYIGVTGFTKAIESAGWLVRNGHGITIPNFDNWMSQSAKTRLKTQQRVNKHRVKPCNAPTVTKALLQDSTGQYSKKNPPTPLRGDSWQDVSGMLNGSPLKDSPDFKLAWSAWVAYRKEARKPLTRSTIKSQLKKLAGMGTAKAVASINRSIECGWTGLFDPDQRSSSAKPPGRVQSKEGKYAGR